MTETTMKHPKLYSWCLGTSFSTEFTDRTRTSVVTGLGKKLKDLMDDFQV
jgi:hypothetical protein